jgi:hypothetical protein
MMADSTSILAILLLAVPFATMQAKPSQKAFWPKILFEIAPQLFRAAALGDQGRTLARNLEKEPGNPSSFENA